MHFPYPFSHTSFHYFNHPVCLAFIAGFLNLDTTDICLDNPQWWGAVLGTLGL